MVILFHTPCVIRVRRSCFHQSLQQHFCRGDKTMIQYLLLQNRQGKTRLSKYYRAYTDDERTKIETDVHRIVTTRDPKFTNFVEVRSHPHAPAGRSQHFSSAPHPVTIIKSGDSTSPTANKKRRLTKHPSPFIFPPPRSTRNTSSSTGGTRASSSRCAST
jgi:hypothetical protein